MSSNSESQAALSKEFVDTLIKVRSELSSRFHEHSTGNITLPPEQSLSLRSHISRLTQVIEPGTSEMWPEYTRAEKDYMEEQAIKHKKDANNIAIAALGPLAGPAILAGKAGAPPEVVGNFLEFGFNMTAIAGLSKVGVQPSRNGVVEPAPIKHKVIAELIDKVPVEPSTAVKESVRHNTVVGINDFISPTVTVRRIARSASRQYDYAEPILEWIQNPEIEKLGLLLEQYSQARGPNQQNLREISHKEQFVNDALYRYRSAQDDKTQAYQDAHAFERRFVNDIKTDGELDPLKLKEVIQQLHAGRYISPSEYAALEQVRYLAHADFILNKVEAFAAMAKKTNIADEALELGMNAVWEKAEQISPYAPKTTQEQKPPAPSIGDEPQR